MADNLEPATEKGIAHQWEPISPLSDNRGYDFSGIDALQRQWTAYRQAREAAQPEAYRAFLERLTRSWAIETGIIEGLYTLDRGVTETLVMRGISADIIDRSSTDKEPQELVQILSDHQDAVRGVYDEIRMGRTITLSAIRQLHSILCRQQRTFRVMDQFGRWFDTELEHGAFKKLPNSPTRADGTIHQYCPPEHVSSEMDNLLAWYDRYLEDTERYHPLMTAAWLHHRFTQIHPFQDGNGRVVRALLTWHLARAGYLPIVVKRDDRTDYIAALEDADSGNLLPFVDLLVRRQRQTILEALGEPESVAPVGIVDQVLDHIVGQIGRRNAERETQMRLVNSVAQDLRDHAIDLLDRRARQAVGSFEPAGLFVASRVIRDGPDERESRYYRQIVQTANNSGHWINFNESRFYSRLSLTPTAPAGQPSHHPRLHFVASFHHTGRQLTGVMATTAFALIEYHNDSAAEQWEGEPYTFADCTLEPFTFTCEQDAAALLPRFNEWIDQRLAIALRRWGEYLT